MSYIFQDWTGPGADPARPRARTHTHTHTRACARQATGFMFVFRLLGCYEVSFKYTGLFIHNMLILNGEDLLAPRPTPMLDSFRLSATDLSVYSQPPSISESILHPQPEDAPCRGDSNPIIASFLSTASCNPRSYSMLSGFKCWP